MDQDELNNRVKNINNLPPDADQLTVNQRVKKTENLANLNVADQAEINRAFLISQNISLEELPA